jgi:hypothetical protein
MFAELSCNMHLLAIHDIMSAYLGAMYLFRLGGRYLGIDRRTTAFSL